MRRLLFGEMREHLDIKAAIQVVADPLPPRTPHDLGAKAPNRAWLGHDVIGKLPGPVEIHPRLDRATWFSSGRAVGHAATPKDPGVPRKPAWRDCTPPARVGSRRRDVARLGGDGAQDVIPSGVDGVPQRIHKLVIVSMGMPIFDNCDLESIGREANRRQRWEFLMTAAPAAVPKATGSVLSPIATF